jgi:type I site-specific restriction-modification system R (restriction) subunit
MLLYAAKIMPARMGNPTLVFITDRNDLDDQLFGEVFAPARILPEQPRKADSRADVRQVLSRASLYEISECLLLTVPGLVELSHVGGSDEQEVDIGLLITLATGE